MRSTTPAFAMLLSIRFVPFLLCDAHPLDTSTSTFQAEVVDQPIFEPATPDVHGVSLNQRATKTGSSGNWQFLWETVDGILPSDSAASALTTLYNGIKATAQDGLSNSAPQQQLFESHYGAFYFVAKTSDQRGIPWSIMVAITEKLLVVAQRGTPSRFQLKFKSPLTGAIIVVLIKLADVAAAA